jgi:hypothetical protein
MYWIGEIVIMALVLKSGLYHIRSNNDFVMMYQICDNNICNTANCYRHK